MVQILCLIAVFQKMEEENSIDGHVEPKQDTPKSNESGLGPSVKKRVSFETDLMNDGDASAIKPKAASLRKTVTEPLLMI